MTMALEFNNEVALPLVPELEEDYNHVRFAGCSLLNSNAIVIADFPLVTSKHSEATSTIASCWPAVPAR